MLKLTLNSAQSTATWKRLALFVVGCFLFASCSSDGNKQQAENEGGNAAEEEITLAEEEVPEDNGMGIGPVKTVDVTKFDAALADKGKAIFEGKCSACHQLSDQKIVGPGLKGVTERRKPEWIMNMIVNPVEMTQKDPQAKKLLAEHLTQMTNQDIAEPDARALLEYLRQNDGAK